MDVSFVKDTNKAVASIVNIEYPSLEIKEFEMIECEIEAPYIPGFLAFREIEPLRAALAKARQKWPSSEFPQIFFIDGNGVLHQRQCGLASHLGVVENLITVGIGKNLLNVDGLDRLNFDPESLSSEPQQLIGTSGTLYGYAALTGKSTAKPIFISPGHRISHLSAARLALLLGKFRVVEPIRQADLISRQYIRIHFSSSLNDTKKEEEKEINNDDP